MEDKLKKIIKEEIDNEFFSWEDKKKGMITVVEKKKLEDFIIEAISQVQAEILQVVLEDVPWKYQDRLIKLLK